PPPSPPFPYTTLFRSARVGGAGRAARLRTIADCRDATGAVTAPRSPSRRATRVRRPRYDGAVAVDGDAAPAAHHGRSGCGRGGRSEEHTSELQSRSDL